MNISELKILFFKNYNEINLKLAPEINCLLGDNGSGKTNFLDAIYYLCMTKSAFNTIDSQNIKHNEKLFLLNSKFNKLNTAFDVQCSIKKGQKKIFKVNKKEYDKLSDHIGVFPCVLVTPYDTDLIRESSELRRKFFDNLICQTDKIYLENLINYNHVLKQRNVLLKQFAERNFIDNDLIEPFDKILIKLSKEINLKRNNILSVFIELFQKYYNHLTERRETVSLEYNSQVNTESFNSLFEEAFSKDLILQRTTVGIHKDDYVFKIGDHKIKKTGSQGQQKSFIIALKLSQYELIKQFTGIKPILLLDDIFDKLDDQRIKQLLKIIDSPDFGQIFITDARPERTIKLISDISKEYKFIKYQNKDHSDI